MMRNEHYDHLFVPSDQDHAICGECDGPYLFHAEARAVDPKYTQDDPEDEESQDAVVGVKEPMRNLSLGDLAAEKIGPVLYPMLPKDMAIMKAKVVGFACSAEGWDTDRCDEQQRIAETVFDYTLALLAPKLAGQQPEAEPAPTREQMETALRDARYQQ